MVYAVRMLDFMAPYLFGYSVAAITFTGNWWWAMAWPVALLVAPVFAEGIRRSDRYQAAVNARKDAA